MTNVHTRPYLRLKILHGPLTWTAVVRHRDLHVETAANASPIFSDVWREHSKARTPNRDASGRCHQPDPNSHAREARARPSVSPTAAQIPTALSAFAAAPCGVADASPGHPQATTAYRGTSAAAQRATPASVHSYGNVIMLNILFTCLMLARGASLNLF